MNELLFGIIAMLGWGFSDYISGVVSKKIGYFRPLLWSQIIFIGLFLALMPFFKMPVFNVNVLVYAFISSVLLFIAMNFFYKGLEIGDLSIISPIASSASMITVVLSIIFLNESLSQIQGVAVFLVIIGTILVSFKYNDLLKLNIKNMAKGVVYALITMVCWGIMFVFVALMIKEIGWFLPPLYMNFLMLVFLLVQGLIQKKNMSFPKKSWTFVLGIAVLGIIAFLAYSYGVNSSFASIVTPVATSSPAVTILLAMLFLKERLDLNQHAGLFLIIGGIVLLG